MTDPIAFYKAWFAEAADTGGQDPKAAFLATCDADGHPSGRVILIQYADERGLTFFTNLGSRKARDLTERPNAELCVYWPMLMRQVRASGLVELVPDEEADAYLATRPRESQIGAWASEQSQPLESREVLDARILECERRFAGEKVPRPPFWSGYRVRADRFEFWSDMPGRLHRRDVFTRTADGWRVSLIYP